MPLTKAQTAAVTAEVARCDQLLAILWADASRDQVLQRRHALLQLLTSSQPIAPLPMYPYYLEHNDNDDENDPDAQYPIEVDFEPAPDRVPYNGAVKRSPTGSLWMFWMPQGANYREQFDSLVGWYQVPLLSEVEDWTFGSVCPTPCDDDLEPDHPDSWLRLLGLV